MRKESPTCRVRVGCLWIIISTVPVRRYPTSSPGCMCQSDSPPAGSRSRTYTISRPGIEDALCWSGVALELPHERVDRLLCVRHGSGLHGRTSCLIALRCHFVGVGFHTVLLWLLHVR